MLRVAARLMIRRCREPAPPKGRARTALTEQSFSKGRIMLLLTLQAFAVPRALSQSRPHPRPVWKVSWQVEQRLKPGFCGSWDVFLPHLLEPHRYLWGPPKAGQVTLASAHCWLTPGLCCVTARGPVNAAGQGTQKWHEVGPLDLARSFVSLCLFAAGCPQRMTHFLHITK